MVIILPVLTEVINCGAKDHYYEEVKEAEPLNEVVSGNNVKVGVIVARQVYDEVVLLLI